MKETITIEKKVYESVLRNTLRVNELEEENAKLKELLKECKDIFDECFSPSVKYGKLYKKIDEALQ